jgi:hypothetical protein
MDDQIQSLAGCDTIAGEIALTSDTIKQLPNEDCEGVMLSTWTVTDAPGLAASVSGSTYAPDDNTDYPVYYGFGGRLFAQLFPGQTTQFFPVRNARQICATTPTGVTALLRYVIFKRPQQ